MTLQPRIDLESHAQAIQGIQPTKTMRISLRRRAHDLADDVTTNTRQMARNLHSIEQDALWAHSEVPRALQADERLQTLENASQSAPKPTVEGTEVESLNTKRGGSPARGRGDSNPKTPRREATETLGAENSSKEVITAAQSPQQNVESSDLSTLKQQLRKASETAASIHGSSGNAGGSPSASGSEKLSRQSPGTVPRDEDAPPSPTAPREADSGKQTPKGCEEMKSTKHGASSSQAEDAIEESKATCDELDSGSEAAISHHICEWRSRYLGLSAAFDKLKEELDVALENQGNQDDANRESGSASHQHRCDDYGIEGLTIIVHRRCKEDLVLNTDLREEDVGRMGEL
ncbi:atp synthase subunit delta [Trichoderma cornu-damae]|uniref:Atp synthase subunit delta n=1 Tax=Trichoderma cornu-damae TaxID=654480 RepID=A0A9P8TWA0_9HYPO|nr:atp synthase subunit delta [Trichoderma cornu-damae]